MEHGRVLDEHGGRAQARRRELALISEELGQVKSRKWVNVKKRGEVRAFDKISNRWQGTLGA